MASRTYEQIGNALANFEPGDTMPLRLNKCLSQSRFVPDFPLGQEFVLT